METVRVGLKLLGWLVHLLEGSGGDDEIAISLLRLLTSREVLSFH